MRQPQLEALAARVTLPSELGVPDIVVPHEQKPVDWKRRVPLYDFEPAVPEKILEGIQVLRHRRHDVIVMHVLDHHEVEFPFDSMTQFVGLEGAGNRIVNPKALRKAYLAELESYLDTIEQGCHSNGVDYVKLTTHKRLDVALSAYLATRSALRRAKGRR